MIATWPVARQRVRATFELLQITDFDFMFGLDITASSRRRRLRHRVAVTVGLFFGVWPANKGAKLDPLCGSVTNNCLEFVTAVTKYFTIFRSHLGLTIGHLFALTCCTETFQAFS